VRWFSDRRDHAEAEVSFITDVATWVYVSGQMPGVGACWRVCSPCVPSGACVIDTAQALRG
jgi:hypothetical protein